MTGPQEEKIRQTLEDANLQLAIYAATGRLMSHRQAVVAPDVLPDYQELRTQANLVKQHTLENLDHYLEQFESHVVARGGKVIYARDGGEVVEFLLRSGPEEGRPADGQIEIHDHRGDRAERAARAPRHRAGRDRPGRVHRATGARAAVSHRRSRPAQDPLRRGRSVQPAAGRRAGNRDREADQDRALGAAAEIPRGRHRHFRSQLPGGGFRRGRGGHQRRQRADDHHAAARPRGRSPGSRK